MTKPQLTPMQARIVELIAETRAEYHACTAAEVARRLKIDKTHVSRMMHTLKDLGVIDFEPKFPGAIWLVNGGEVAETTVTVEPGCAGDTMVPYRSPAQIAHTEKLGRLSRERAEARMAERAAADAQATAAAQPQAGA